MDFDPPPSQNRLHSQSHIEGQTPPTKHAEIILDQLAEKGTPDIDLGLDRIRDVLTALDAPHAKLPPCIHIAGTNGKGSTAAFLFSILKSAGHKIHRFTSPYLVDICEQYTVANTRITDTDLARLFERIDQKAGALSPTKFEIETAAAFLAFAETSATIALIEAGMGGATDCTNVLTDVATTVITPIDMDHQAFLGDTVSDIAQHKAGIMKPGVPAIVGPQNPEALDVLTQHAERIGSPLYVSGTDWQVFEQHERLVFQDETGLLDLPLPGLAGRFQIENAGIAIAALRLLAERFDISPSSFENGIANAAWPARLTRLSNLEKNGQLPDGSEIYADAGHNAHAAQAIAGALADFDDRRPMPIEILIGIRKGKDLGGLLSPFAGLAASITAVTLPSGDGYDPEGICQAAAAAGLKAQPFDSLEGALAHLEKRAKEPCRALIFGSHVLAGEALRLNHQS